MFEELFGGSPGGRRGPVPQATTTSAVGRGRDAEVPITVSFHEAMHGVERQLRLNIDGEDRLVSVRIPAGVASGKKLRVRGEGHRGVTERGDLHLVVTVETDARFSREGDDLRTVAHVPLSTLLLGGSAEVATLQGTRTIRIGAGTATSAVVRIRKQGAPILGKSGEHGDLYVKLEVEVPRQLSESQLAAAEALKAAGL
jgi:curved DNA-binding protein